MDNTPQNAGSGQGSYFFRHTNTTEGSRLCAQVTHHTEGSKAAERKARCLSEYLDCNADRISLVSFCRGISEGAMLGSLGFASVSVDEEVLPWILSDARYRGLVF